jgi:hypothetical protein
MATVKLEIPNARQTLAERIGYAEMQAVSASTTEIHALERGLW